MESSEPNNNQPIDIKDVDLPGQLSGQQLKFGYWFTTNRLLLRRIFIILMIVLAVLLWSYTGYRLIMIYVVEDQGLAAINNVLPKNLVNYQGYKEQNQPQQLAIGETQVLSSGSDRYD
ncbi:MAG: hypothetical protein V1692_02945, partial [bacterium]